MLVLTDATRQQIERHLRKLGQLEREMAALEAGQVLDCKDYRELCALVHESLTTKYNHFWPRQLSAKAKKGNEP